MKKNTLANLLLLTSVAFFTACSNKQLETPKVVKPKLTALDIIGIDTTDTPVTRVATVKCTPSIEDIPLAKTYPMPEEYYTPSITISRPRQIQACVINIKRPIEHHTSRPNLVNNIEWGAKELIGHKYVWGATGPRTYDCSGFTQKVYRDAGIRIPRVSRDQAKVGEYVSFNNLRKGDLIFFDTHKHLSGKVTHVGIYLGNGNFIHASSAAKKIVIFNFNKKTFYKKRFLWGRRLINSNTRLASL